MPAPDTWVGIGLAMVGVGFPAGIALMKIFPFRNAKAPASLPPEVMTEDKCKEQREDERKIVGGEIKLVVGKVELVAQRVEFIAEGVAETKKDISSINETQTAILKAIKIKNGDG